MMGHWEIVVIGVLVIIFVFGASQIPKIAKSLGEGIKEFKKSIKETKKEDEEKDKE